MGPRQPDEDEEDDDSVIVDQEDLEDTDD